MAGKKKKMLMPFLKEIIHLTYIKLIQILTVESINLVHLIAREKVTREFRKIS